MSMHRKLYLIPIVVYKVTLLPAFLYLSIRMENTLKRDEDAGDTHCIYSANSKKSIPTLYR